MGSGFGFISAHDFASTEKGVASTSCRALCERELELRLTTMVNGDANGRLEVGMEHDEADDKFERLQRTVRERLDPRADYADTLVRVVKFEWTAEQLREAMTALDSRDASSIYYVILMDDFGMRKHFSETDSHREWIVRSYNHLRDYLPEVTAGQAKVHDLSKYSLEEALGYTLRWVYGRTGPVWENALEHHYRWQPHHPQYWTLHQIGNGSMPPWALQESLLDMVACRWERQLAGRPDVSRAELVDFESKYLLRYLPEDRTRVEALMANIRR